METISWLRPSSIIDAIAELPRGDRIDSIEIFDLPPTAGAVGHEAFLAQFPEAADSH